MDIKELERLESLVERESGKQVSSAISVTPGELRQLCELARKTLESENENRGA